MSEGTEDVAGAIKTKSEDRSAELEAQNTRLQLLIAELLLKNERLRSAYRADQIQTNFADEPHRTP